MRRIAAAAALSLAGLACVPPRPYLGDINLRRYTRASAPPETFGVEKGRLVSGAIDLAMDPDGCMRGTAGDRHPVPYVLCPKEPNIPPEQRNPAEKDVRWMGDGGDLTTRVSPDGKFVRVDGLIIGNHGVSRDVHVTLPLYQGAQWDELREHPVLIAVAAGLMGISGEPPAEASPLTPPQPAPAAQ